MILGGYGNTGRPLAELLLESTDHALILAGRRKVRAAALAGRLAARFPRSEITARFADASQPESLRQAFVGVDLAVIASSTAEYAREVAQAALAAGCDYLDVQVSETKFEALQRLRREIESAGLCFITDGGFHPGIPAALVRYAGTEFDRLRKAIVGSVIKMDWASLDLSPPTLREFVQEFQGFKSLTFRNGAWRPVSGWRMVWPFWMHFGPPFGRQYNFPMFLEELRCLPEAYPDLQETGFYVGGMNWFVDLLLSPVLMAVLKFWPQKGLAPMSRLMDWGLRTFSRPPYGTQLQLEAHGELGGLPRSLTLRLYHEDGYRFTAIPVLACLWQVLDGSARRPGLWTQANLVEPRRFLKDLEHLGVRVETQFWPS